MTLDGISIFEHVATGHSRLAHWQAVQFEGSNVEPELCACQIVPSTASRLWPEGAHALP